MRTFLTLAAALIIATPTAAQSTLLIEIRYDGSWWDLGNEQPLLMEFTVHSAYTGTQWLELSGRYTPADAGRIIFAPPDQVEAAQSLFGNANSRFAINPQNMNYGWSAWADDIWVDDWFRSPSTGESNGLEIDRFVERLGVGLSGYDLTAVSQTIDDIHYVTVGRYIRGHGSQTIRIFGKPMPPPVYPPLDGDYNQDGTVDAADYIVWRKMMSIPEATRPDLPNVIDGDPRPAALVDYHVWRLYFSEFVPPLGADAVPEPASWPLVFIMHVLLGIRFRR